MKHPGETAWGSPCLTSKLRWGHSVLCSMIPQPCPDPHACAKTPPHAGRFVNAVSFAGHVGVCTSEGHIQGEGWMQGGVMAGRRSNDLLLLPEGLSRSVGAVDGPGSEPSHPTPRTPGALNEGPPSSLGPFGQSQGTRSPLWTRSQSRGPLLSCSKTQPGLIQLPVIGGAREAVDEKWEIPEQAFFVQSPQNLGSTGACPPRAHLRVPEASIQHYSM